MWKSVLVTLWLAVLAATICFAFWRTEWKYSLPTPVPASYKPVAFSSVISLPGEVAADKRPVFLHFFNPDCPCSRFNIPHFRSLVNAYGRNVRFIVVPMTEKPVSAESIRKKLGLDVEVSKDTAAAARCGVYSTPQAVLIDESGKLFYRGNYNKSRYCTDKATNYAEIALEGLMNKRRNLIFDQYALKAYGCQLPDCKK